MLKPGKHKVLSSSRSVITTAKINSDTQKNNQTQQVVIVTSPQNSPQDQPQQIQSVPNYPNIYDTIPPPVQERSVEDVISPIESEIQDKDNIIQALSLIIDIMRSNPLIINKYIVASSYNLQELILLLTGAETVDIQFDDPEISCFCSPEPYLHIRSIYVTKNGSQQIFKHSFPTALRILDENRISTKITILDPEPQTKIIQYN